jgi:D-alanine-D-alanine ligase
MQVAVLAGGRSPEHDVSLASARQVLLHLDRQRHRAWPVFLDRQGRWWPDREPLAAGASWQPGARARAGLRPGAALDFLLDHAGVEVVLPALHGPFGEDGTVQGMLALYGIPCVGSGCAASAMAMDKVRTRECLAQADVPMPAGWVPDLPLRQLEAAPLVDQVRTAVGLPCFCKVDCSGSTLGVARIEDENGLALFLAAHRDQGRRLLCEELVPGEEITVAVLGNWDGELQALPPVGIYPRRDPYFTHDAKYEPGRTEELIPPRGLDRDAIAAVQAIALRCHRALGCDGMSRTDLIVGARGPRVLEVNTIPGLTGTSLLPQAAAAAGIPFPALLDRLLDLALERAAADRT